MRYLCLIYANEQRWQDMSPEEAQAMVQEYVALTEDLRRTGHFVGGNRLQPVTMATTVRVREGQPSVTDGPFAETKEQLGGYYLIEARDLNEAIRIAARLPGARIGSVEVRPIMPSHLTD